jgi:drug/metabolite transporter (DMT)-like permease
MVAEAQRAGHSATLSAVTAIVFGLATAVLWATTLLGSARSARLIGTYSTLAWVMLIGLGVTIPMLLLTDEQVSFSDADVFFLVTAGIANSLGLVFVYTALRRGKVSVVGPIVSTEGAIGAVLAIVAGDPVTAGAFAILAVIALGVVMAATESPPPEASTGGGPVNVAPSAAFTALLAIGGAVLFGVNIFATGRIADLPVAWAVLPARLAGFLAVTIPLLVSRRIRLTRSAVPFVVLVGIAEVAGTITLALGSRDNAPVTSVLASQFAAIAAVSAFVLYGERLNRLQITGVVVIAVGVAVLAALTAG